MTRPIADLTKEEILKAFEQTKNGDGVVTSETIQGANIDEPQKILLADAFEIQKQRTNGISDQNPENMTLAEYMDGVNEMGYGPEWKFLPKGRQLTADAYKMFSEREVIGAQVKAFLGEPPSQEIVEKTSHKLAESLKNPKGSHMTLAEYIDGVNKKKE